MENKTNFRIIITKQVPNPHFAEEVAERERHGYHRDYDRMTEVPREISVDVLVTEISEEQFKVVQTEILKVFK